MMDRKVPRTFYIFSMEETKFRLDSIQDCDDVKMMIKIQL